jgi:hypothetical protein
MASPMIFFSGTQTAFCKLYLEKIATLGPVKRIARKTFAIGENIISSKQPKSSQVNVTTSVAGPEER